MRKVSPYKRILGNKTVSNERYPVTVINTRTGVKRSVKAVVGTAIVGVSTVG